VKVTVNLKHTLIMGHMRSKALTSLLITIEKDLEPTTYVLWRN